MIGKRYNPGGDDDLFGLVQSSAGNALSNVTQIAKLGGMGQSQRIEAENQAHQQEEWGRQTQFRQMFSDAWQSGDNAALERVMGMFPEFIPQMQQSLGLKDDQHNQKVASLMMKLNGLVNSGDTAGARQLLQANQSLLNPGDMDHWNAALTAMEGKDTGAAAKAKQGLDQYTKAMIRASFKNPTQMMESMLHQSQQEETARRDSQAHEDRIRGQNISASNARYRASHPLLGRGGADHTKGMRGHDLAKYIVENGVMPDGSHPQNSDFDWAERTLGLKKTTGARGGGTGGGAGGTAGTPGPSDNLLLHDIDYLSAMLDSNPDSISPVVGYTGGIGQLATGADAASKYREANGDTESRKVLAAVKRIQGAMQNKGIQAARDMGASGINTEAEAERFFQAMPQLDFSSIDSLRDSLMAITDYVNNYVPEDQGGGDLSSDDQSLVDKYYQGE